eukprot:gnl/Carplike_NY0171/6040_a8285_293.p1 GENE.gnl/Carplike_NY0171/6040_a8285_293~~gnl/Carplike_NY0171/6040_a8285_293.p1  ORF type:complete len:247 (-),score=59.07 gnl/Carplike_NY0171/6040_a8285_293:215-850(-)
MSDPQHLTQILEKVRKAQVSRRPSGMKLLSVPDRVIKEWDRQEKIKDEKARKHQEKLRERREQQMKKKQEEEERAAIEEEERIIQEQQERARESERERERERESRFVENEISHSSSSPRTASPSPEIMAMIPSFEDIYVQSERITTLRGKLLTLKNRCDMGKIIDGTLLPGSDLFKPPPVLPCGKVSKLPCLVPESVFFSFYNAKRKGLKV